jgi:biotin carboxyl carrier protein
MSTEPQIDINILEQTRKQINRLVEQIAQMSESDMAPTDYYGEFLQRVLSAVAAPAGAVWVRTPQGNLQLQYQVNLRQVGLDGNEADRQSHDGLLRWCANHGRAQMVPPHSGLGPAEDGNAVPGNPTNYMILIAPILVEKQVAGLVEVWQDADRNPKAQEGFLTFITRMAELASSYTRNHQLRQMVGQQALWTQLEAFARQIHGSLNPMEVGYAIANEGRRLIDCDRVSVALRTGKKTRVEAISGADVVEKRSNLVRLMAALFNKVLIWGEKLIYKGTHDDSLPPDVLHALDAYLAESNSKLLVILPLRDEREAESKKPPRSGLMMECFDPASAPEQLIARLEVIGRHSTSALYNAAEHRRIPMRFVWQPLAKVQEGLGGKTRAILLGVAALVAVLALVLVFVPYPLKMDAKGQLLPRERRYIYSPVEATIDAFRVEPGQIVSEGDPLVTLHDVVQEQKMVTLHGDITGALNEAAALDWQLKNSVLTEQDKAKLAAEKRSKENTAQSKTEELRALEMRLNAEPGKNGSFTLRSPIAGTVLDSTFKSDLTGRMVKPNEPILRVGNKVGQWEIELKIPQKHVGQVLKAFDKNHPDKPLDVDLILRSAATRTFRGKLYRVDMGGQATPNQNDNNESDPIVMAYVRIDDPSIDPDMKLPHDDDFHVTGTEVVAKVRCGNHPMGYSLFYGVWEFIYEKIVFFF